MSSSSGSNFQRGSNSWLSPSVSPLSSRGSHPDSVEASSADHNSGAWLSSSLPSSAVVVHSRPRTSPSFRGLSPSTTRERPYSGTNNDKTSFVVIGAILGSLSFSTLCLCINLIKSRSNLTSRNQVDGQSTGGIQMMSFKEGDPSNDDELWDAFIRHQVEKFQAEARSEVLEQSCCGIQ